jgi:hypothetical protein
MQSLVYKSSTEAELIGLCAAVQRTLPLWRILLNFELPIRIFQDNLSCIKIAQGRGEGATGKRRYFRVCYGFLAELLEDNTIALSGRLTLLNLEFHKFKRVCHVFQLFGRNARIHKESYKRIPEGNF